MDTVMSVVVDVVVVVVIGDIVGGGISRCRWCWWCVNMSGGSSMWLSESCLLLP